MDDLWNQRVVLLSITLKHIDEKYNCYTDSFEPLLSSYCSYQTFQIQYGII